eukprot:TRINITY_DN5275_c0_g1_i1.p1 TRINITY_DN5275_c0_g1~~TRINITY_DN5275_c0_g1_i1.p1  ORF type:complete len:484 (-),score=86.71 TRINITY_DN5275_c0_g1_i1:90-1541(-)
MIPISSPNLVDTRYYHATSTPSTNLPILKNAGVSATGTNYRGTSSSTLYPVAPHFEVNRDLHVNVHHSVPLIGNPPSVNGDPICKRYVIVELYHKQRGKKGMWSVINLGDLIRVTKRIGKRIKVVVRAGFKFEKDNITLILNDVIRPSSSNASDRFSIESTSLKNNEVGGKTAEIELKIFTLSKKLEFEAKIECQFGAFIATSPFFETHNSGKQRKKKEIHPDPEILELVPYQGNLLKRKGEQLNMQVGKRRKQEYSSQDYFATAQQFIHTNAIIKNFQLVVAILPGAGCVDNFFLVLYKDDNLYSEDTFDIEGVPNAKYISINADMRGKFSGIYTAVICFKNKNATLGAGATSVLVDFRDEPNVTSCIPCNLIAVGENNLYVAGKFIVVEDNIKWINEDAEEHTQPQPTNSNESYFTSNPIRKTPIQHGDSIPMESNGPIISQSPPPNFKPNQELQPIREYNSNNSTFFSGAPRPSQNGFMY